MSGIPASLTAFAAVVVDYLHADAIERHRRAPLVATVAGLLLADELDVLVAFLTSGAAELEEADEPLVDALVALAGPMARSAPYTTLVGVDGPEWVIPTTWPWPLDQLGRCAGHDELVASGLRLHRLAELEQARADG